MATTIQGEIRIGPNHQARVPPLIKGQCEEATRETAVWKPDRLADTDLLMFLRAARSMAAFAGMCDGGSSDDGFLAASRDQTTATAMEALHQNAYDTGRALHDLVKKPIGHTIEKTWTEDDIKKFVRGLKQHGKNFFRIRRDLLSHKETCDLVEFYYLWKKSPAAVTHRPRQRPRRGQMLRRGKTGNAKTARATPSENSSTSDSDSGCDDSDDNSNLSGPCRHCEASETKEWHRVDKEGTVLCTDCKLHFDEARNDVIRANDPNAMETVPPAVDTNTEQGTPAKRIKTETVVSAASHLPPPPPPLIPAVVNVSIATGTTFNDITPTKTTTTPAHSQPPLPQSVAHNLSPTLSSPTQGASSSIVKKEEIGKRNAEKEEENTNAHTESASTVQDDFVQLLSTAGGKALDPKIDDTECHRSSNAIFRRHWNRGDNSCARTDLIYVPIPRPNATVRSHDIVKEKSPVRPVPSTDVRRVSSSGNGGTVSQPPVAPPPPQLDSSMPALQRLRDYASAATGSFVVGGGGPVESVDHRYRLAADVLPGGRVSPAMVQPPPLQYATPGPGLIQRAPAPPTAVMPPYELLSGQQQFEALAAERWLAAEHQRMQWERAVAMNPAAANDMAVRLQLERMMAGSMPLTHTHAHTHLHIHAARAAAAMQQNQVLGGFPPVSAAWAAAAARPNMAGALDAFNQANMLYGAPPTAPPSFPPPGFMQPHILDSITAERFAQQQHILELFHQRQMMSDRD